MKFNNLKINNLLVCKNLVRFCYCEAITFFENDYFKLFNYTFPGSIIFFVDKQKSC